MVSVEPPTQKEKHQRGGNDLTLSKNNMQYIEKKSEQYEISSFTFRKT